jgi:putative ABC transport system ATP-binding protein/lipoprotein-releasing system ATP-binding protein
MDEPLVQCTHLGRTYTHGDNPVYALKDVSIMVHAGDRIALIGPSGGGKSTLLQIIGGMDTPDEGEINWPALGKKSALRPGKIGYVFQTQSLLAPLTVLENVELPLLLTGDTQEHARECAMDILNQHGLNPLADKLPEELSGGQAQRVAVVRAFVGNPALILADEPTGQLDHPTAYHLFDVLFASLENTETALVVATHDTGIAKSLQGLWSINHGHLEVIS